MIINTVQPYHPDTEQLRQSLSEEYDIPVIAMSVESLRKQMYIMYFVKHYLNSPY